MSVLGLRCYNLWSVLTSWRSQRAARRRRRARV